MEDSGEIRENENIESDDYKGGLVYSEKLQRSKSPLVALWKTILFDSNQAGLFAKLFIRSFAAGKHIFKASFYKRLGKFPDYTYRILKSWAMDIMKILQTNISMSGIENIEPNQNYLFTCNHLSPIDIPLIYSRIPVLAGFIANQEISMLPVFGYWMKASNAVFLKKGDKKSELTALKQIITNLENGFNQILFPESVMSKTGFIQDFQKGGLAASLFAKKPILPIYVKGTREIMKPGDLEFRLGENLIIHFDSPVYPEKLSRDQKKNIHLYLHSIYEKMQEKYLYSQGDRILANEQ